MWRYVRSELLKLRKSPIWLLVLISPVLSTLGSLTGGQASDMNPWLYTLTMMAITHGMLFMPLLTGVFAAFVCRYEHIGGGWKQVLALPVSRSTVYIVKLAAVMGLLLLMQCLFLAGLLLIGTIKGFAEPLPWAMVISSLAGGWLACLPLAALQMAVSAVWSSFAAPLAVNVIFTLPNILLAYSDKYGPWYPWAQPLLAMIPRAEGSFGAVNVPLESLFIVILGSFAVFFIGGLAYFRRHPI